MKRYNIKTGKLEHIDPAKQEVGDKDLEQRVEALEVLVQKLLSSSNKPK